MKDIRTYRIQLRGPVAESEINPMSPLEMTVVSTDPAATQLSITTDQSGLIGLLRHIHGQGFVLLSVICELLFSGEAHVNPSDLE